MKNEDVRCENMKMFDSTLAKILKTAFGIHENLIEIFIIRKNQVHVLRPLKLGKMVSFGNFAKKGSLFVGFPLCTLHGHFFSKNFSKI